MHIPDSKAANRADQAPGTPGQWALTPAVRTAISEAVAGIDYGSVEVVIHNGKVVQIEARRKVRFDGLSSR